MSNGKTLSVACEPAEEESQEQRRPAKKEGRTPPAPQVTGRMAPGALAPEGNREMSGSEANENVHQARAMLEKFLNGLDSRERTILVERRYSQKKTLLDQLAERFSITRERTRQIEAKAVEKLHTLHRSPEAAPLRLHAQAIRDRIEAAISVPRLRSDPELALDPEAEEPHGAIMLELAGPYRKTQGWLVREDLAAADPTPAITKARNTGMEIDLEHARKLLSEWGLPEPRHIPWLLKDPKVSSIQGRIFRPASNMQDRVVRALEIIGRPATREEMEEATGDAFPANQLSNFLNQDSRFKRIGIARFALTKWGLGNYQTTALNMREILNERGTMHTQDLVQEICARFGVRRATALAYTQAPMFVRQGETIRNRTPGDPPFRNPPIDGKLTQRSNFFHPEGLVKHVHVTKETLRGSGIALGTEAAAVLNHQVGETAAYDQADGAMTLTLTYPESSFNGPNLSSLKYLAESLQCRNKDIIVLRLNPREKSFRATIVHHHWLKPGWDAVAQLLGTGPGQPASLKKVANALGCLPNEVWEALGDRRENTMLEALPVKPPVILDPPGKRAKRPKRKPLPKNSRRATNQQPNSAKPAAPKAPVSDPVRRRKPHAVRVVRHELPPGTKPRQPRQDDDAPRPTPTLA